MKIILMCGNGFKREKELKLLKVNDYILYNFIFSYKFFLMDTSSPMRSESEARIIKRLASLKERRMRLEKIGSYRVGRTLGRGNFAVVRISYHEISNCKVAMKIVDRRNLDAENLTKMEREIEVLKTLNHPFVIKLYEVICFI